MDNRRFSRVSFKGFAHLDIGSHSLSTEVLDLSLQGALIKKPEQWPPSLPKLMQLRIQLNDLPVELTMKVSVAHESGNVVGLHCEKIDIESVSHLRRLLELNLGDAELLSRELSELSEH
ncbi:MULTISPECIES: PilZ domain-containing protein [Rheinheimera]|jgi:hypothetical protein|nr:MULTISPECIES: PilZ domain-containing protein [Rheinheimera]MCB5214655.1 PilZ domain-containing protein [Rheinheimera aquimaris]HBN88544.1 PilZ domain-containing protein [Rheinheimera sp.]|tara:strand:- start:2659 stop:3015 length:357 start_codon:yes stop_codon:yes gene_type:complete